MSAKNSQTLKQLQTRKAKLESTIADSKLTLEDAKSELNKYTSQLASVNNQINQLKDKDIIISEHAILRYMERVMGVDMEAIKERVLTNTVKTMIGNMGNGKYPINGGGKAVVRNNTIITVET